MLRPPPLTLDAAEALAEAFELAVSELVAEQEGIAEASTNSRVRVWRSTWPA